MRNIYGFHHVCFLNNGRQIFEEQIERIINSGLYKQATTIFFTLLGSPPANYIFPDKYQAIFTEQSTLTYERKILEFMYAFSQSNTGDFFYLHTKGVSHYGKHNYSCVEDWRRYMEYFLIDNWAICTKDLENYDAVGVNYRHYPKHYSGNFWWARSGYVKTSNPNFNYKDYYETENWILRDCVNSHNYYESNINHYHQLYPAYNYVSKMCRPPIEPTSNNITINYNYKPVHHTFTIPEIILPQLVFKNADFSFDLPLLPYIDLEYYNKPPITWIETIDSSWKGLREFATALVNLLKPEVIVDLGVDTGYSTFVFADALRFNHGNNKIVYGIDNFKGDVFTGFRDTYDLISHNIKMNDLRNISIIRGEFSNIAETWAQPIDILHIDGFHEYESVKADFDTWSPFVKEHGLILIHDVCVGRFGCNRVFLEAASKYKLFNPDSGGLGILTDSEQTYNKLIKEFPDLKPDAFL